jgi:hypothetical protein
MKKLPKQITFRSVMKLLYKHIGKTTGAVIGMLAGLGFFGIALGILVGLLIDELLHDRTILKQGELSFTAPGDNTLDAKWACIVAAIGLAGAILLENSRKFDSKINAIEKKFLTESIAESFGLSARDSHIAEILVDRFFLSRIVNIRGLAELYSQSGGTSGQETLIQILFNTAQDEKGYIDKNQSKMIKQISIYISMPIDRFNQIREDVIQVDEEAYKILGVSRQTPTSEVKRIYHRLAGQFHPDHGTIFDENQKKQTEEAFLRIKNAYQKIIEERKSQRYS